MPANKTRTSQFAPLGDQDRRRLRMLGDRLGSILRIILKAPPCAGVSLRDLAGTLGLDFSTCQRIARGAACPDPVQSLAELPGPAALQSFVRALAKQGVNTAELEQAKHSVEEYQSAIHSLAGSHAKLKRRIAVSAMNSQPGVRADPGRAALSGGSDLELRIQMAELAAKVLRVRLRGQVTINACGPVADHPDMHVIGTVSASLGYVGGPGAHPLIAANFRSITGKPAHFQSGLGRLTDGDSGELQPGTSIIERLCSQPLPRITSLGQAGRVLHVVDAQADAGASPIDIVSASRAEATLSPMLRRPTHELFYVKTRLAPRRVILDVFMHHSYAKVVVPTSGVIQTDPALLASRSIETVNAWEDRLPSWCTLQQLGYGLGGASSDLWEKHAEAAAELFARLRWNPDEFMLYRVDVPFPIWNAFYYLDLDFPEEHSAQNATANTRR